MDSTKIETFQIVSKFNSFSKAAEKLFITPAAVKKQIDSLENEIGAVLFTRKSSGCYLTEAGKAFVPEAEKILKTINASIEKVRQVEKGQEYEIHIGHSVRLSLEFISNLTSRFNEKYPMHYLYFERMKKTELATALENQTIDCFLFINPLKNDFRGTKHVEVGTTGIYAVVNKNHPLADKSLITYDDLMPYQVYIPSVIDTALYNSLEADLGTNLRIIDKSNRNEMLVQLLKSAIILYPGEAGHDISIPFDYPPLPIQFYYRSKDPDLINLFHEIQEILKTQTIF